MHYLPFPRWPCWRISASFGLIKGLTSFPNICMDMVRKRRSRRSHDPSSAPFGNKNSTKFAVFPSTTMLVRSVARAVFSQTRLFSSSPARHTKVAVLGAGGGIGQPLSLLLKSDPLVSSLSLYDIRGAPGVAADVSHVDTPSEVSRFSGARSDHLMALRCKAMPQTSSTRLSTESR